MFEYEFIRKNGHIEVYKNGKFICSADTMREAEEEVLSLQPTAA